MSNSHFSIKVFPAKEKTLGLTTELIAPDISIEPSGITIIYGLNSIPLLYLDLPPSEKNRKFYCEFEKYRHKAVVVQLIVTNPNLGHSTTCLSFTGIIYGVPMDISPGVANMQVAIVSIYQYLLESYLKLPGFHPSSENIICFPDTFNFDYGELLSGNKILENPDSLFINGQLLTLVDSKGKSLLDPSLHSPAQYIVNLARVSTDTFHQLGETLYATYLYADELKRIAKASIDLKYNTIIALLENIDCKYAGLSEATKSTNPLAVLSIFADLAHSTGSIFDFLIRQLTNIGCNLIIANDKAFVVPDIGFLKQKHDGSSTSKINEVSPRDYASVSFHDTGYKDIKAVGVIADPLAIRRNPDPKLTQFLGFYLSPDESTKTGAVLVTSFPTIITCELNLGAILNTEKQQFRQVEGRANCDDKIDYDRQVKILTAAADVYDAQTRNYKEFFNNWAEIKYYQMKYMDRTGSVELAFNPYWVCGVPCVIYLKQLGLYIDAFVTTVKHSIYVSPPHNGRAFTTVTFNCGRIGYDEESIGIDNFRYYNYSIKEAKEFAAEFLKNCMQTD